MMTESLAMTGAIPDRDISNPRKISASQAGYAARIMAMCLRLVFDGKWRLGNMKTFFARRHLAALESRHEIQLMYFGRVSEFLLVSSERVVIPSENYTLEELLKKLRKRGGRWADELDARQVVCTVGGKVVALSDTLRIGDEIDICSRKSIFEA